MAMEMNAIEFVSALNRMNGKVIIANPVEAVREVKEWVSKNPPLTNSEKFNEVFGFLPDEEGCPMKGYGECNRYRYCEDCPHENFWQHEFGVDQIRKE